MCRTGPPAACLCSLRRLGCGVSLGLRFSGLEPSFPVDLNTLSFGGEPDVMQARVRDADALPSAYGSGWCLDEFGDLDGAAQSRDQISGEQAHCAILRSSQRLRNPSFSAVRYRLPCTYGDNSGMDPNDVARLIAERKEKQAPLARMLGITPDKFNKSIKGVRAFKPEELETLARYFGVEDPSKPKPTRRLPIVGLVSAGAWRDGFLDVRGYIPSPDPSLSGDAFVVQVDGTSMNLIADDGELIIVDPRERELVNGRLYVIRNGDGEMTFKRYLENPARLEPCSNDPSHKAIFPGQDGFEVIGRARMKVSSL